MRKPSLKKLQKQVDDFNARVKIGDEVDYFSTLSMPPDLKPVRTRTAVDLSSVPNTAGTLIVHGDATIPEQAFRKFDTVHIYPTGRLTNNGILICKEFINDGGVFVDNGTTIKTKQ